jgi:hypothetical protein
MYTSIKLTAFFICTLCCFGCIPSALPHLVVPESAGEIHSQFAASTDGFHVNALYNPLSFLALGGSVQQSIRKAHCWELDGGFVIPSAKLMVLGFYGRGDFGISPSLIYGGTNEYTFYYGNYSKKGALLNVYFNKVGLACRIVSYSGTDNADVNTGYKQPFYNRKIDNVLAIQPYIYFRPNKPAHWIFGIGGSLSSSNSVPADAPTFHPSYISAFIGYDLSNK